MYKNKSYPKTLFNYLIKLHLKHLITIFVIFFIIIFFVDLIELFRRSSNKIGLAKKENSIFLELVFMTILKAPNMMEKIFPLTILIGSIITFVKWRQNNYFVIVRSIGISMWKILIPICLNVFVLGVLSIIILNPISSIFNKKYDVLENNLFGHKKLNEFSLNTKGLWIMKKDRDKNFIINAKNVNKNKNILNQVLVFKSDHQNRFESKINAKQGIIIKNALKLKDGIVFSRNNIPKKFNDLILIENYNFDNFKILSEKPRNLDIFSLFQYIKLMKISGINISNHLAYLLKVLCQPILMISMVLISASLILRNHERKFPVSISSITLIIGFIIYFVADLILALGSMEKINPFLAGIGPTMISFFSGCFLVSSFDEIRKNEKKK